VNGGNPGSIENFPFVLSLSKGVERVFQQLLMPAWAKR
jgi:hypothetical protein